MQTNMQTNIPLPDGLVRYPFFCGSYSSFGCRSLSINVRAKTAATDQQLQLTDPSIFLSSHAVTYILWLLNFLLNKWFAICSLDVAYVSIQVFYHLAAPWWKTNQSICMFSSIMMDPIIIAMLIHDLLSQIKLQGTCWQHDLAIYRIYDRPS